jgi:excisionase family DNA binding protein
MEIYGDYTRVNWYTLRRMKIIGTAEAARRLGVTPNRVRALISSKRLKATQLGREWMIDAKDLDAVKTRRPGRPRKPRKGKQ